MKIEAEDSPDGLVAITVTVKDAGEEEDEEEEEGEPGGEVLQTPSMRVPSPALAPARWCCQWMRT